MRGGAACYPYKAKHPVDEGSDAAPLSQLGWCWGFLPYMGSVELREKEEGAGGRMLLGVPGGAEHCI